MKTNLRFDQVFFFPAPKPSLDDLVTLEALEIAHKAKLGRLVTKFGFGTSSGIKKGLEYRGVSYEVENDTYFENTRFSYGVTETNSACLIFDATIASGTTLENADAIKLLGQIFELTTCSLYIRDQEQPRARLQLFAEFPRGEHIIATRSIQMVQTAVKNYGYVGRLIKD